ncbi:hypothetical protein CH63R_10269 [Colletotrichum higginsianum IMI 349063]|uniref:Uncharacterized protein n=1 Tax=Colletotrichum higginsianum (strain IMI 349063) TaxID=759273 RepID=A0A1B7Y2A6_COLHI|nr:uncharacterized protein CH63R_10269 [Colletotrichum higginsianum IMI 349063]OBR06149.1 hypothetical protein CH63R_10269 [Colletotrichum higginsianum IMI 349063]
MLPMYGLPYQDHTDSSVWYSPQEPSTGHITENEYHGASRKTRGRESREADAIDGLLQMARCQSTTDTRATCNGPATISATTTGETLPPVYEPVDQEEWVACCAFPRSRRLCSVTEPDPSHALCADIRLQKRLGHFPESHSRARTEDAIVRRRFTTPCETASMDGLLVRCGWMAPLIPSDHSVSDILPADFDDSDETETDPDLGTIDSDDKEEEYYPGNIRENGPMHTGQCQRRTSCSCCPQHISPGLKSAGHQSLAQGHVCCCLSNDAASLEVGFMESGEDSSQDSSQGNGPRRADTSKPSVKDR